MELEFLLDDVFRGDELADEFAQLPRPVDVREVALQDGEEIALAVAGRRTAGVLEGVVRPVAIPSNPSTSIKSPDSPSCG